MVSATMPLHSAARLCLTGGVYLFTHAARLSLATNQKVTVLGQAKPDHTVERLSRDIQLNLNPAES